MSAEYDDLMLLAERRELESVVTKLRAERDEHAALIKEVRELIETRTTRGATSWDACNDVLALLETRATR